MLNTLTSIVRILAGTAIFTGVILMLAPERKSRRALQLVCSALLSTVLLITIGESNIDAISEEIASQKIRAYRELSEQEDNAWEVYKGIIKSETEAYIWKQAQELGIERLGVRITLRDGETAPFPWSIELIGIVSYEQQETLTALLEGELGIPAERQQWSICDAD